MTGSTSDWPASLELKCVQTNEHNLYFNHWKIEKSRDFEIYVLLNVSLLTIEIIISDFFFSKSIN